MNVSGILVVVRPERVAAATDELARLDGIDVHHCDAASGRIVITQEAETIQAEVDGLKRIKALPYVILAEMAYHCFEEDRDITDVIPQELDELEGMNPVPPFLQE
ncbi:MAG: chaperone NapD [Gammaproteobacteria bacterium]|jgi:nitrate reductase NapD